MNKSVVILSDLSNDGVVALFEKYAKDVGMFEDYIEDRVSDMGDDRKMIVKIFEEELGAYVKVVD